MSLSSTNTEKVEAVQQVERGRSGGQFWNVEFESSIRYPGGDVK